MIWDIELFIRNMQELKQRKIKDAIKHEIIAAVALSYSGFAKSEIWPMSVEEVCEKSKLMTAGIKDDPTDLVKAYLSKLLEGVCRVTIERRDADERFFSYYSDDRGLRDAMTKYASTGFESARRRLPLDVRECDHEQLIKLMQKYI